MSDLPASDIVRGACRALVELGFAPLLEVSLANGRRADIMALDRQGSCAIVEIKSSRTDFVSDRKWPEYLEFCDLFYFAVAPDFPREVLPAQEGLILADRFAGEVLRPAAERRLSAARRKAVLVRFARAGAFRLHGLLDAAP